MKLEDLGYTNNLEQNRREKKLTSFDVGRVVLEHKERYVVKTEEAELDSELVGNLRFTAESRYDFPAVGDWVAITEYDEGKGLIHGVLKRNSILERKAVGKMGQVQIIAANIDVGMIVQAVDRDFNLNRLERYLTLCNAANVQPVIVLSKVDLIDPAELVKLKNSVQNRLNNIPVIQVSNQSDLGYRALQNTIEKGKTYCLLGSSGVGKSTILNALSGVDVMKTGEISTSVNKGKHVTSHRELVVLDNGGIIIDNPGMREVGMVDNSAGIEITFEQIAQLSGQCRYADCTHVHEHGCAILEALENGELDKNAYDNYQKLERENKHFESSVEEKRKKDKDFGKMVRQVKNVKRRLKY